MCAKAKARSPFRRRGTKASRSGSATRATSQTPSLTPAARTAKAAQARTEGHKPSHGSRLALAVRRGGSGSGSSDNDDGQDDGGSDSAGAGDDDAGAGVAHPSPRLVHPGLPGNLQHPHTGMPPQMSPMVAKDGTPFAAAAAAAATGAPSKTPGAVRAAQRVVDLAHPTHGHTPAQASTPGSERAEDTPGTASVGATPTPGGDAVTLQLQLQLPPFMDGAPVQCGSCAASFRGVSNLVAHLASCGPQHSAQRPGRRPRRRSPTKDVGVSCQLEQSPPAEHLQWRRSSASFEAVPGDPARASFHLHSASRPGRGNGNGNDNGASALVPGNGEDLAATVATLGRGDPAGDRTMVDCPYCDEELRRDAFDSHLKHGCTTLLGTRGGDEGHDHDDQAFEFADRTSLCGPRCGVGVGVQPRLGADVPGLCVCACAWPCAGPLVAALDFSGDADSRRARRVGSAPAGVRRARATGRDEQPHGSQATSANVPAAQPSRGAPKSAGAVRSRTSRRSRPVNLSAVSSRVMSSVAQFTDTRKPCPYCSRKFAPGARERHVDVCKNVVNRPSPQQRRVGLGATQPASAYYTHEAGGRSKSTPKLGGATRGLAHTQPSSHAAPFLSAARRLL